MNPAMAVVMSKLLASAALQQTLSFYLHKCKWAKIMEYTLRQFTGQTASLEFLQTNF